MPDARILMAVVGRPHGVRGLSHVQCFAQNQADLRRYGALVDEQGRQYRLRWQGEGLAAICEVIDGKPVKPADRNSAERLTNKKLYVERARLPAPDEEEFYVADLVGLAAVAEDGREIGRVAAVHDHGAGTFLEVGPLLLPFTKAAVPVVDIAAGRLVVVPPAEIAGDTREGVAA